MFGPLTISDLDSADFNEEKARKAVLDALKDSSHFPKDLFIHGLRVLVKGRTLHRASTVSKHSRFLANLTVTPIFPPEPEPVA
jgi:hypothetical protein